MGSGLESFLVVWVSGRSRRVTQYSKSNNHIPILDCLKNERVVHTSLAGYKLWPGTSQYKYLCMYNRLQNIHMYPLWIDA